mmetsp:Transcript_56164/g.149338  ORF Transcript_56164/g.149338 Transcript_56164/m.149338 type:complete len:626 (-) Transcript_56164:54-1931(-)
MSSCGSEAGNVCPMGSSDEAYELLPVWKELRSTPAPRARRASISGRPSFRYPPKQSDKVLWTRRSSLPLIQPAACCGILDPSRFATNPTSRRRILWEAIGTALILYDLVTVPLQAFALDLAKFGVVTSWAAALYWTADVPFSFLVGFYADGALETRISKTAAHYCRTWCLPDILLVINDWALFALESADATHLNYIKAGRALRLLRFLRLLRLLKMRNLSQKLVEQAIHSLEFLNSEYVLTTLRVAKLMVMIIVINHFVACSWYGIASMLGDERSWVNVHFSSSDDLAYRYGTSLHWSLTQFTPASMEVFPTNSRERAFNVCVVIFALLTFSSFISSITEAMTSIRKINGRRNMQYASMRQYLRENRVSMQLAVRVRHYLQQSERARQTRRVWRDVELFQELPEVLQMELRYEVYARLIARHPFFHQYGELDPSAMKALCHRAVREVPLVSGQELFGPGQVADRMYFVVDGSLSYDFQGFGSSEEHLLDDASPLVSGGQWFAEAAVWVRWFHLGSMVAKTPSLVLALDVTKLHVVMAQYVDTLPHCRRYAQLFAENARCRLPPLSDVCSGFDDCQDTAQRAFETEYEAESGDEDDGWANAFSVGSLPNPGVRRPSWASVGSLFSR